MLDADLNLIVLSVENCFSEVNGSRQVCGKQMDWAHVYSTRKLHGNAVCFFLSLQIFLKFHTEIRYNLWICVDAAVSLIKVLNVTEVFHVIYFKKRNNTQPVTYFLCTQQMIPVTEKAEVSMSDESKSERLCFISHANTFLNLISLSEELSPAMLQWRGLKYTDAEINVINKTECKCQLWCI